jgi:hypothetical protein
MFQCMLLLHPDLRTQWQVMWHMSLTEERSECTRLSQKDMMESDAHALTCEIKTEYRSSITMKQSLSVLSVFTDSYSIFEKDGHLQKYYFKNETFCLHRISYLQ